MGSFASKPIDDGILHTPAAMHEWSAGAHAVNAALQVEEPRLRRSDVFETIRM